MVITGRRETLFPGMSLYSESLNRPFQGFSPTFHLDQLGKIRRHHKKERLEIAVKLLNLKVIRLKGVKT